MAKEILQRKPGGGTNRRPLTKIEILRAQRHSTSAMGAARWLGVAYETYRKYAMLYEIHEQHINQGGRGSSRPNVTGRRHSLTDIINGKHPKYDTRKLKKRLIKAGYLEEECSQCGLNERRITDYKVPLILIFKDGNNANHKLDNMTLLCYNCTFLSVGDFNNLNPYKVRRLAESPDDDAYMGDEVNLSDAELDTVLTEAKQQLNKDDEVD